jgi:hypothetical protein
MSFRPFSPEQFSVELLKLMQAAYDGACGQLNIDGTSDARSATLANVIMDLAAEGERERLLQRALEAMSQPKA